MALSRLYEEHVLATGSLDERIFTGEGASEDIGTPGPCLCEGVEHQNSATFRLHTSLAVRPDLASFTLSDWFASHLANMPPPPQASALKVSTPLTGRKYVQEGSLASPLSSAMKSVGRLHTLLSGTKQGPSAKLAETLRYVSACLTSSLTLTLSTRLLSFRPGAAPETRATPSAGA